MLTFEQMLDLCKRLGCEVYIETKVDLNTTQYDIVFGLIRAYGMEQKCVWCPQNLDQLNHLVAYEPNVYINLHSNLPAGTSLQQEKVDAIINATTEYNKFKNSITVALGGLITEEQFDALAKAGVGLMGTTLNTVEQIKQYYNQGKPYTGIKYVLSNTLIAGKVLFDTLWDTIGTV